MRRLLQRGMRALARLASWPLVLVILFEEWGWEPLQRALLRIARALGLQRLEERIRALPPYGALVLFLLPTLMLLPVKLAALWLIAHDRAMAGMLVIVVAKLAGTAIVARLFALTRATLVQLAWFALVYTRWTTWKDALLAQARASWPWRWARVAKRRWRRRWQVWRHG